ncbi:MAG: XPG N-terminal domain-containing protein [Olpidium bornovanus]|uniref:XPG N-terminal domain-containing protein n=1 Tax=Olpidium bornovanus TaxID=278681 RepID=A0A8H8DHQ9_9FUNG|nr:MAG: XPG N-terminal domain-containing protein [Olpidium bornovanus]
MGVKTGPPGGTLNVGRRQREFDEISVVSSAAPARHNPLTSPGCAQGLWDLVSPVARKVKLESLAGTRLAVDASIWLHQFLKAMRDKEGNALQNAHTLGFFRRICKLLFFNVKPVFVFDGGVPELKRQTMVRSGSLPLPPSRTIIGKFTTALSFFAGTASLSLKVERRKRRTGQVNNLAKTAEKLLAAQMKMAALKEAEKKRQRLVAC